MIQLGEGKQLFEFQKDAAEQILETMSRDDQPKTIVLKSPTGSGKTITLLSVIDQYLEYAGQDTAIIWLCLGNGDLEVQYINKAREAAQSLDVRDLQATLGSGFAPGSVTFINWEQITKKGNRTIQGGDYESIFGRIGHAHRAGTRFIIIVDEEHSYDTRKAREILATFDPIRMIHASATAVDNTRAKYIQIPEQEVIDEGLITRFIFVNDRLESGLLEQTTTGVLLKLARLNPSGPCRRNPRQHR